MRALVRLAWADAAELREPERALPEFFEGVFIGPARLRHEFVKWGLTPGPKERGWAPKAVTAAALRALQRVLRDDLGGLADATGVWRGGLPAPYGHPGPGGRKSSIVTLRMKAGKTMTLDLAGAKVFLPESVRARINRYLPRHELDPSGSVEPLLDAAGLRGILYYALAIALSRDVLLRCGKCGNCGALVVYQKQPPTPLGRCFCVGGGRDCKTEFHNAGKTTATRSHTQKSWRARQRSRRQRAEGRAQAIGTLESFLDAVCLSPDDPQVMRTVRRIGGGVNGWQIIKKWEGRRRRGEPLVAIWGSLSDVVRKILSESWSHCRSGSLASRPRAGAATR